MRRWLALGAAVMAAFATTSAESRALYWPDEAEVGINGSVWGYTYFNKPGADLARHNADVTACRRLS